MSCPLAPAQRHLQQKGSGHRAVSSRGQQTKVIAERRSTGRMDLLKANAANRMKVASGTGVIEQADSRWKSE